MNYITQPMIQFFVVGLMLISSIFFYQGIVVTTPELIAELSKTKIDYNPDLVRINSQQKANTVVGFVLLIVAIILQVIGLAQPTRWMDMGGLSCKFIIISILLLFLLYGVFWVTSKIYANKIEDNVLTKLEQEKQQIIK